MPTVNPWLDLTYDRGNQTYDNFPLNPQGCESEPRDAMRAEPRFGRQR